RCSVPPEVVLSKIIASPEYWCVHGNSAEGFVTGLYTEILCRQPCPCEVRDWAARVACCPCRDKLVRQFMDYATCEKTRVAAVYRPPAPPVYPPPPDPVYPPPSYPPAPVQPPTYPADPFPGVVPPVQPAPTQPTSVGIRVTYRSYGR